MAKVLCLDGEFDKARDIYEYALQKLPANHKGRDVRGALPKTAFFSSLSFFLLFSHPSSSSPFPSSSLSFSSVLHNTLHY